MAFGDRMFHARPRPREGERFAPGRHRNGVSPTKVNRKKHQGRIQ